MAYSLEQEPFPYPDENLHEGTRFSLDGDFYNEPDDVVRSCEVKREDIGMSVDPYDSIGQDFAAFKGCGDDDAFSAAGLCNNYLQNRAPFSGSFMEDHTHMRPECRDDLAVAVFTPEHVPSEIPIDPHFHFAATTVQITLPPRMIAADIGNLLLNIFETRMHALVQKVRPVKFWIKVDVFVNYVMCTLKVQVYRTAKDNMYVVEFMRRGGDTVAFMATFQKACDFLSRDDISLSVVGDAGSQLPHPCSYSVNRSALDHEQKAEGDEHLEALLAPVLDMAAMCSQPLLQTESAVILAQIVERNAEKAAGLCTGTVFQAIRHLLSATLVETLYPTACLLLRLASCQHAEPFFADYALLMALLDQVQSEAQKCRALVTHRLALVISISIERCGPRLSFESAQRLQANVSHVLKKVPSEETRNCLQEVVKAISKIIE